MSEFLKKLAYAVYECREERGLDMFGDLKRDAQYVADNYNQMGIENSAELRELHQMIFGDDKKLRNEISPYLVRHGIFELEE